MLQNPLAQRRARVECLVAVDFRPRPRRGTVVAIFVTRAALLIQAVDVCQIECPARCRAARLILQHDRHVPVAAPLRRDQRVAVEDVRAAVGTEILP